MVLCFFFFSSFCCIWGSYKTPVDFSIETEAPFVKENIGIQHMLCSSYQNDSDLSVKCSVFWNNLGLSRSVFIPKAITINIINMQTCEFSIKDADLAVKSLMLRSLISNSYQFQWVSGMHKYVLWDCFLLVSEQCPEIGFRETEHDHTLPHWL